VRDDFIQFWDQISADSEGRWTSVEYARDVYNWKPLDRIFEYARAHRIPVKAFGLVWGSPTLWMSNLSPEEQRAEIEEWIQEYCARYPDVAMIEVIKDALPGHFPAGFARHAFGDNWITDVFTLARQHCPNAILIYDDYNFLTWDTDAILDLIEPAVKAGVVDAVGLQAHYLYDPKVWTAEEIRAKLDLIYERLGVSMYISEYDIGAVDDEIQLRYMQMHFPIFYEHPHVAGITLWGYVYGQTLIDGTGLIRDGQPRPALTWLMDYLDR
jgi:GH35 family endo-1,4-beta-xylanase